jgi:glycine/D-amino acid oxidase-like deaminating enzyme
MCFHFQFRRVATHALPAASKRFESLREPNLSSPARSDARRWGWGQPPWKIEFRPTPRLMPEEIDVAVVGGGFTGLAAAAWLRRIAAAKTVAVFEAQSIGSGASGRTGGMVLAETAVGDLPGLGDVLAGFSSALRELSVDCDLHLPGTWEIGRTNQLPNSPIDWQDSGDLRATGEVPGGTVDPGKLVSGLARAAEASGALILENAPVQEIGFTDSLRLRVRERQIRASHAILATNAFSLELTGLAKRTEPKLTLAVATRPLKPADLEVLGLASGRPFYTIDLPYLWGRVFHTNGVIFGGGIIEVNNWRELETLDISTGKSAELIAKVERRVRGLHPSLRSVGFSHWWGGPILFGRNWAGRPVFESHPELPNTLVLGAYSGHGVALSAYLGCWAAEVILGRKTLPSW